MLKNLFYLRKEEKKMTMQIQRVPFQKTNNTPAFGCKYNVKGEITELCPTIMILRDLQRKRLGGNFNEKLFREKVADSVKPKDLVVKGLQWLFGGGTVQEREQKLLAEERRIFG